MTTYNTKNPVPSSDARDRYDNSQVFDELMNGAAPNTPDRLGVLRQSWAGMETEFQMFLANSGLESTHLTYVDGAPLVASRPTQLIDRAGSIYRVKLPASFPVTLTGMWATDQNLLVDVGDAALRASLAASSGSDMVGFTQAGTGAVTRTAQSKMRDTVSVKDFGAVGDGVGDDTVAIQAAIDYTANFSIMSATGGRLLFPAGMYQISAPLVVPKSMVIEGAGGESTKIRTTTGNIFEANSGGIQFVNMCLIGPTGAASNGIRFTNGNNCIIERCTFQNQTTGIELVTSYAVEIIGCIFDVCFTHGVYAGSTCHNLIIERSGFFSCGVANLGQAVNINAGSDNLNFINNDFEQCNVNIQLSACNSVQITGNYMEYHVSECFYFSPGNTGIIVESNWIALGLSGSGGDTLTFQNITGGRFRHNTMYNQSVDAQSTSLVGFTFGLNKHVGTGTYDPSTWISPILQNSWAQQGNFTTAGFMKDENGWVWLRGGFVGGTAPSTLFTLTAGHRPAKIGVFSTQSVNGQCRITVNPDGTVVATVAAANNACLDGISFFVG